MPAATSRFSSNASNRSSMIAFNSPRLYRNAAASARCRSVPAINCWFASDAATACSNLALVVSNKQVVAISARDPFQLMHSVQDSRCLFWVDLLYRAVQGLDFLVQRPKLQLHRLEVSE